MQSQIILVTQDFVADRAAFKAYLVLLHNFDQIGMHYQIESVANAFGTEKNRIEKFSVCTLITLSSVHDDFEPITIL